nr:hypothetical protein [Tanacetum cinerariifolium]
MTRVVKDQGRLTQINNEDFYTCMFSCFLSQEEPKRVHQALKDPNWIEAMQEELLQFKMKKVWIIVDLLNGKRAIGHTQEEGIDYEEVFASVARIEAIRLFLAYASFMGFMVYQMDVKSDLLYGTIEEEVYVCQPPGFEDSNYPDKVYKVVKALYGLHQAPRAWYETLANYLLENDLCKAFEKLMKDKFQMSSMGELTFFLGLQVKQKPNGIFISQDKYVAEILRKFSLTDGKSASTLIDTEKPLLKDPDDEDVDVHTYRSMISSLMYLTSLRPDIMFAGKPHLGLWYLKDSPFNLVAYSDNDYAGASLDRKSTTRGCQFLGCRLISWQCKKQTIVVTSSTEAEYVAAASCCAQVLLIQNQLLDYGLTMQVTHGSMKLLERNVHVINILSAVKKVNDVIRLQALIDRKKVIITEATVREALRLDDAESIDCLPNEEIFTELSRMGVGNRFSRVETPLFEGMIVAQQDDDVADEVVSVDDVSATDAEPTLPSPTPTTQPPPPSHKLPSTSHVIPTLPPSPIAQPTSPPQQQQPSQPTHDAEILLDLLHTLLETYTTLTGKVEALEQDKVAQALEIIKLKKRVKKLKRKNKLKVFGLMRLRKVGTTQRIESSADTDPDVQGRPKESQAQIYKIDIKHADKVLSMQDDELELAKLKEVVTTAKLMTEVVTAVAATITDATSLITDATITTAPSTARRRKGVNMTGFKMDYFKGMSYDDVHPIFEKYFNSNVACLEKTKEPLEEEESRALKRKTESSKEKAVKKQKLDEEVEELKKHLQILPNNDDDVYTEATPLALKVPIVDYEIYSENNKPYYKIIRADGSHHLFLSFLSLLRNFDREDLEMILLVERRYPLTRFTLDQMLNNIRLEVEEEIEVSLELLGFVRQQQQEGFRP